MTTTDKEMVERVARTMAGYDYPELDIKNMPSAIKVYWEEKAQLAIEAMGSPALEVGIKEAQVNAPAHALPSEVSVIDENELAHIMASASLSEGGKYSVLDMKNALKAIRPYLRTTEPVSSEVIEAIKALTPFEVVQGDAIHRTNPTSKQVVNSSTAWAVSQGERSAHKIRKFIEVLNNVD